MLGFVKESTLDYVDFDVCEDIYPDENTAKNTWPKFIARGGKDGKELSITWIAGEFETTQNDVFDKELKANIENISNKCLDTLEVEIKPRSALAAYKAAKKFFNDEIGINTAFYFFNMPDPQDYFYKDDPPSIVY